MFCLVRAVRKFDIGLVRNEHLTNGDQYVFKKLRKAVTGTHVFDRISKVFPPTVVTGVKGQRCAGQLHSLE